MNLLLTAAVAATLGAGLLAGAIVRYRAFRRSMEEETDLLLRAHTGESAAWISEERLRQLPRPVSTWLSLAHLLDRAPLGPVTIIQEGMLRTKPEGQWMPFRAKQHASPDTPSFIWKARIQAGPGIAIYGRDLYVNGQADMLIKLAGLFKVAHARGPEIDQGSLVRYLAEIVWYPAAALSPLIAWEALDDNSARAVISYKGISASGIFYFQTSGEPVQFVAQRYKEAGGACTLEEWSVRMGAYKRFQDILIPSQGEVSWNLRTGPFPWLRFEIKDVRFEAMPSDV